MGKSSSLKTGCDFAIKNNTNIIIVMDADGQHNPDHIPRLIKKLETKDIVFTHRKFSKHMPFILRFGNTIINRFKRVLQSLWISLYFKVVESTTELNSQSTLKNTQITL